MENTQEILLELDEFNNKKDEDCEITQNLENFLEHVAKTGTYTFPWVKVKKLFITKTKNVLSNLNLSSSIQTLSPSKMSLVNQLKSQIIERFESFNNAPFTIQRISELLLKPTNNYTQQEKYLRGLEKCLLVVTTIDPNGNKILVENGYTNGKLSESEETFSKLPSTPLLDQAEIQVNKEDSEPMIHDNQEDVEQNKDQSESN
ncbi:serine threonine- phosphatase 4 regulatory subunit 2 [Brachionus plicatilis]|uniref:Serine threonine-phosphatase 4 regulatory subunit 2 n=1 Tax=Brachionus plicatilis TaxID=10195 RepID=A0A3M7Q5L2_BRAPC|nr:serine threonine- phosphatase 4 regulatory subunit 2 [Brachionus plicatilis]